MNVQESDTADKHEMAASIVEQLDKVSNLAERGQSSVVNAGPIMVVWGAAILSSAILEYVSSRSTYVVVAWTLPILVAYVFSLIIVRSSRSDSRAITWRSRALHQIWLSAGTAIVIFNVGEELRRNGVQSESEAATALILAVAALSTAQLTNRKTLTLVGAGWIALTIALFAIASENLFLPVLALGAIGFQIVPGILLMRSE